MRVATTEGMEQVRAWLLERKPELSEIDPDMDLIDQRIIDSLSFIEFLFFLEEVAGRDLQEEAQSVEPFRTLRAIERQVLQAGA